MCRWITRVPIEAAVSGLRAISKKDLVERLNRVEHCTRRVINADSSNLAAIPPCDPFEFVPELDLFSNLKCTNFDHLSVDANWVSNKQALDILNDTIGVNVRIKPDTPQLQNLLRTLKILVKHSHFVVSSGSIRVIGRLAVGLRENFSICNELQQFRLIVGRLKDKKLVEPISETLYCMVASRALVLDKVVDELSCLVDSKKQPVPHARIAILNWLTRCVSEVDENCSPISSKFKSACVAAVDMALDMAESAARKAGENLLQAIFRAVNNDHQSKEHQHLMACIANLKTKHKRVTERALAIIRDSNASTSLPTKRTQKQAVKETSHSALKSQALVVAEITKTTKDEVPSMPHEFEPPILDMQKDECLEAIRRAFSLQAVVDDTWETSILSGFCSRKWQERCLSFKKVAELCSRSPGGSSSISEAVVVLAKLMTNHWREKNVNVINSALDMIRACADSCSAGVPFEEAAALSAVPCVVERFVDRKTKESACAALTSLTKFSSLSIVIPVIHRTVQSIKATTGILTALQWTLLALDDCRQNDLPLKVLCTLAHSTITHRDAEIRAVSVDIFTTLYKIVGPCLRPFALPDYLQSKISCLIEDSLDKVALDLAEKKSKIKPLHREEIVGAVNIPSEQNGQSLSKTRKDISAFVDTKQIISDMNNTGAKDSWKDRKNACQEVAQAVTRSGNCLIASHTLLDVLRHIKHRLNDSQTNIKPVALDAIVHILRALESISVAKALKVISFELVGAIQDNKKAMREKVIKALDDSVTLVDGIIAPGAVEVLFPAICAVLRQPLGRAELLRWLTRQIDSRVQFSIKAVDMHALLSCLLAGLSDKNKETRIASRSCLQAVATAKYTSKIDIENLV